MSAAVAVSPPDWHALLHLPSCVPHRGHPRVHVHVSRVWVEHQAARLALLVETHGKASGTFTSRIRQVRHALIFPPIVCTLVALLVVTQRKLHITTIFVGAAQTKVSHHASDFVCDSTFVCFFLRLIITSVSELLCIFCDSCGLSLVLRFGTG